MLYFDDSELKSIVGIVEIFEKVKINEPELEIDMKKERSEFIKCPGCGTKMIKEDIGPITVDICPTCHGKWLDDGEILALKMAENHIKDHLELFIRLGE